MKRTALAAALLGLVSAALAHGGDEHMDMGMGMDHANPGAENAPKPDADSYPPSYFTLADHAGMMYAHIGIMTLSWIVVLPIAVMLSLARSRYTLAAQFVFLATNGLGVLLGTIYNASTPDLYPNNAHHKIGWIATWVVGAQVLVGLLGRVAEAVASSRGATSISSSSSSGGGRSLSAVAAFIPVSTAAMAEHTRQHQQHQHQQPPYRLSNDSGQGTEPNTESLRSPSGSSHEEEDPIRLRATGKGYADDEADADDDIDLEAETAPLSSGGRWEKRPSALVVKVAGLLSSRARRVLRLAYAVVDRTILLLGFVALCTGIITYARFFEGHQIFTGLAHWIKGGIFFWLGILFLGRWAGCFGELGWAWNMRPKSTSQKWRPSAEFVESALIFTYGATNIFLEHLGNWGKGYSPQDLEHISITVLFIGGGLCGMLVESTRIRDLLNTTVTEAALSYPDHAYTDEERDALQPPREYEFSINPIPALVIVLLGIMMGSHTQTSMVSSMVHKQWGNLLTGASFARGLTYVLLYLKPPRSVLPSRPPTELLASFGMIAGGIIFMASSGDTIDGMEHYDLDAMFIYTVTMGFVGLLMAWVILLLALKGWATRREAGMHAKLPKHARVSRV